MGKQVTVKLTHSSNHPDAADEPGDVIPCDEAIANRFIDGNGAVLIEEVKPARKPRAKKQKPTSMGDK